MSIKLSAFPKCYLDRISHERSMSVFDWIEQAKQLDADGLEMYEGFLWQRDNESLDRVREAVHQAGFVIPMLCCSPDFIKRDPAERQRAIAGQAEMMKVARRLGGPGVVCRILSGQRDPNVTRAEGVAWVVEAIEQLLPLAHELDVVLGMENHYKDGHWRYPEFAQQRDVFLEIVDRIDDRTHFGVQYDPSNAVVAGDDPLELLRRVADRVVSMHASDRHLAPGATLDDLRQQEDSVGYASILRHGVVGQGLNDYDAIFGELARVGYRGWISIEDGMNGIDEMAESLAFLRRKVRKHFGSGHAEAEPAS